MIVADCKAHDIASETYIQSDKATYYIAEPHIGKTLETVRQAISRDALILTPWESPYSKYGFNKFEDGGKQQYKVTYASLAQLRKINHPFPYEVTYTEKHPLRICVDEGRVLLEELLREKFCVPVKIEFMSLDAGNQEDEDYYNE